MIFKNINTRGAIGDTDSSADTVYQWAEKLFYNFKYLERMFGTGVLEGGDAAPIMTDTTRGNNLRDSTMSGTIVFETPLRASIAGKKVTFDATSNYDIKFSGWQWTPIWKAYRQGSKGRNMIGPNQPPFVEHSGSTYVKFMSDPIFDTRFVYFWNRTAFFRYDTQHRTPDFALLDSDRTYAWDSIDVRDISIGRNVDNVGGPWEGATYLDGHIYFAPHTSGSVVRFKIADGFKQTAAWQQVDRDRINYAKGGGGHNGGGNETRAGAGSWTEGFFGCSNDGEYVYFAPYDADIFARFDHEKSVRLNLTMAAADTTCWEFVSQTVARNWKDPDNGNMRSFDWKYGQNTDAAFMGCVYDPNSNCVYYAPYYTGATGTMNGFVRFNKARSQHYPGYKFQDRTCWEAISFRDAFGGQQANSYKFSGVTRFGRFIYYQDERSGYVCRYDTSKEWDATEAMRLDTTTGFEWLDISDYLPDGPIISAATAGGRPLVAGSFMYLNSYNWKRLWRMKDSTSWVTRYSKRSTATFMSAPESDWERISTSRIVSPGWRTPMQTDRTREVSVFATLGLIYADGHVYYQPYSLMNRWTTGVTFPTPKDWNNYTSVPVRYAVGGSFTRGQDEPKVVGLYQTANPFGKQQDIFEYRLQKHYWAAAASDVVTDVRKRFTDTSAFLPLWVITPDDQRRRLTKVADVRNFIPETRKSIKRTPFKGMVTSLGNLPKTGNRNGDVYLVRTTNTNSLYMWYDAMLPVAGSHSYWYPLFPGGTAQDSFTKIQFESRDGIPRGTIDVDGQEDTLSFKRLNYVDYVRGQGSLSDHTAELMINVTDDLNMRFHNILNAAQIDSSGMLRIDGILKVDGTAIIHGNIDATNVDFDKEITANKIIMERGNFLNQQSRFRVGDLNIISPERKVTMVDFVTNNLTVKKPGWPQTYGTIDGINLHKHGTRHVVSTSHLGVDGTSTDVVDATNLPGLTIDLQVGKYLMGYEIRGVPDATHQLTFNAAGGYWEPTFIHGMS